MAYYHVRITQKSNAARTEVKLDFTLEELERRILEDYRKGRPITIGGKSIAADDIERVRISTTDLLSTNYRARAKQKRANSGIISFRSIESDIARIGKDVTDEFITGPPGIESRELGAGSEQVGPQANSRDVFVVHGRNEQARKAMFEFLRSIDLNPLEWSVAVQGTGRGSPYIGEILRAAFSRAHAVVVLFTPDDQAWLQEPFRVDSDPAFESKPTGQARPNVLFEAGMAMGRYENRTILVEVGILRPFSDVAGRHMIRPTSNPGWRKELAKRLETAGCPVDLERTDCLSAGELEASLLPIDTRSEERPTGGATSEEQRFFEMLNASRKIRERISNVLFPAHSTPQASISFEVQNIVIELGALASQMSALGMNELNERLETKEEPKRSLYRTRAMLGYFEIHVIDRDFEGAKREFASY